VFVTQFIFNTAWFVILAVFVPYAVRHLGLSAAGVGTTLSMYGVGMVVGALMATRVMRWLPFGSVIGLGPVAGFVASAIIALTAVFPTPLLAGLGFFLLGAGPILWVIPAGRRPARPLGAGLGALVGGLLGAEACLYLAVAGFAMQMLVILMSRAVSLARQPEMACD